MYHSVYSNLLRSTASSYSYSRKDWLLLVRLMVSHSLHRWQHVLLSWREIYLSIFSCAAAARGQQGVVSPQLGRQT